MRIAITGATGFIGGHLKNRLTGEGHEVVRIGRHRIDDAIVHNSLDDVDQLTAAFAGCKAVAHCAGINREIGGQTYARVHVDGTRNVIEAARRAGVDKILFTSFLRARPDCGSAYHESKWTAEEVVRNSGLDFTIIKAGDFANKGAAAAAPGRRRPVGRVGSG